MNTHNQIVKVDAEINTPVSFLAQSSEYTITELNAIRFFALNLLQSKMARQVAGENKGYTYRNSMNTKLKNTLY